MKKSLFPIRYTFWLASLLSVAFLISCGSDEPEEMEEEIVVTTTSRQFNLGSHTLTGISSNNRGTTVIYESGLGGDASGWGRILREVGRYNRGLAYSRGGYANSEMGPTPRNLQQLVSELHEVKLAISGNDKVVLVGHSWGGAIVRTYAIAHPDHVQGIVFVDPSHELELRLTQQEEDDIVDRYAGRPGPAQEAEQLKEGVDYLATLPDLPNMPITVITNGDSNSAWAGYHRRLGRGISSANFQQTFVTTGHNIHINEPEVVIQAINDLMEKL